MKSSRFLCAAACMCLLLPACTPFHVLEAESRVDPQTIALYDIAAGSSACPLTYADYTWDEKAQKWVLNRVGTRFRAPGDFHDGAIPIRCLKDSAGANPIYNEALTSTKASNAKVIARNRLAAILMKHSDDVCTVELGRLASKEAMVNTGLSVLTSGLSTASAIVATEAVKSILAGGAAFSNATRTHINAEVYRNVLSTAVARAIEKKRDDQRKAIITNFKLGVDKYTVDQMVMEVNEYHQTCSFYRGIGLVLQAVDRPTTSESEQLLRSEAALAQRTMQVASAERALTAVPKGANYDAQRQAASKRLQDAQDKYDSAVDTMTAVGTTEEPPQPPPDNGNTVGNDENSTENNSTDNATENSTNNTADDNAATNQQ